MPTQTAFQKRIKRRIIGREHTFFAATAPGLEQLCRKELQALPLSLQKSKISKGGVEFNGRLHDGFLANLYLRTAGRILMRIDQFKATNFRQLEKRLTEFPWELHLNNNCRPAFHITCHKSRLYHTAAIEEYFQASVDSLCASDAGGGYDQNIFIRIVKDRFTVSLDSSGTNLYKRGLKKSVGQAPIRETLAAAILLLAGYQPDTPLIDPMCGSGTFSLEAAMRTKNIPAGWFRTFTFQNWPAFRLQRWRYLKKQAQNGIRVLTSPLIFASDQHAQHCAVLKKTIAAQSLQDAVQISRQNFFDINPADFTDKEGLIVINPPYGRRLGHSSKSETSYLKMYHHLQTAFRGWRLALLAPNQSIACKNPFKLQPQPLLHGGLKLKLLIGDID